VAALFVLVAMVTAGCSAQQKNSTPEAQPENLPTVGSLDEYLAQNRNDNPYIYAPYAPVDPFMIDPFLFAPYWYSVPVYYFPVGQHRHHEPMGIAGFGGGMSRLGGGHMLSGRR
jgi:hypothetical protein